MVTKCHLCLSKFILKQADESHPILPQVRIETSLIPNSLLIPWDHAEKYIHLYKQTIGCL